MYVAPLSLVCRQLMVVAFLPPEHIQHILGAFDQLCQKVDGIGDNRIQQLYTYFSATWIGSPIWPPSAWSPYHETIHTNNDFHTQ